MIGRHTSQGVQSVSETFNRCKCAVWHDHFVSLLMNVNWIDNKIQMNRPYKHVHKTNDDDAPIIKIKTKNKPNRFGVTVARLTFPRCPLWRLLFTNWWSVTILLPLVLHTRARARNNMWYFHWIVKCDVTFFSQTIIHLRIISSLRISILLPCNRILFILLRLLFLWKQLFILNSIHSIKNWNKPSR